MHMTFVSIIKPRKRIISDLYQGFDDYCICFQSVDLGNVSPEATPNVWNRASFLTQGSWTGTMTSKLLLRAGITSALAPGRVDAYPVGVNDTDVPITNQSTGYSYHADPGGGSTIYGRPVYDELNGMANASYSPGHTRSRPASCGNGVTRITKKT